MIRVLHILGSLQRGGAETMVMNIYRKIDRSIIQFDFLLKESVENGYEEEVKALGGKIYYVESPKKIGILKYIVRQRDVMKNNGPFDVVHSHVNDLSGLSLMAAKLAGIPIRISHSHNTQFPRGVNTNIGKLLIKLCATKYVACGQDAGKALFGKASYKVIPNGIDTERFLPTTFEDRDNLIRKLGMKPDVLHICHIGRFTEQKNHTFIIELAEELKNENIAYQLFLLGEGELFGQIKSQIQKKEIDEVVFCGNVSNAFEYLKATDLFILPSLHEGLPVTLVEAQCSGLMSFVSEGVTPEVDFGLGLIDYLRLDISLWVEKVKKVRDNKKSLSKKEIFAAVAQHNYDINLSSQMVLSLYKVKGNS